MPQKGNEVATGRESDKFMLRLPDGMRERIKAAADRNNRSMNAEIVAALEDRYPAPMLADDVDRAHRETTIRAIDATLQQVRANMIRQLETGGPSIGMLDGLFNDPGNPSD